MRWNRLCLPKEDGGLDFRKFREFNMSLVAKQGWQILIQPHTLISHLLKAKYFPQCQFFEAANPSFF